MAGDSLGMQEQRLNGLKKDLLLTSNMGLPPRRFLYKHSDLPGNCMEFAPLFIGAPVVARARRLADEATG